MSEGQLAMRCKHALGEMESRAIVAPGLDIRRRPPGLSFNTLRLLDLVKVGGHADTTYKLLMDCTCCAELLRCHALSCAGEVS